MDKMLEYLTLDSLLEKFMIEVSSDLNCDVEHSVPAKWNSRIFTEVIDQAEYRGTHDYLWHFL